MNRKIVLYLVGVTTIVIGVFICLSAFVSFLMEDALRHSVALSSCGLAVIVPSCFLVFFTRPKNEADRKFGIREGFAIVALGWLAASMAGAVSYMAVADFYPADAFFESVSGFSTTGATVIGPELQLRSGVTLPVGVEDLPKGLQFFRCLSNWLGGMGIVVLTIAILPLLNIGGQSLYNAETTGVKSSSSDNRIAPRIASAAKILWLVYLILTVAEAILLKLAGMSFFDSVCHAFTTVATGGFSTRQMSIAAYHSPLIEWIIIVFMFLSGTNFMLHIRACTGHPKAFWQDEEFRFYALTIAGSVFLITISLIFLGGDGFEAPLTTFRTALFQVVSLFTSTGYTTADYATWPIFSVLILFLLSFLGGCGGSTSGGLKCVRGILLFKFSVMEIRRCIFPSLVPGIRLNGVRLEMSTVHKTVGFLSCYLGLYLLFALLLALFSANVDLETCLSASIACLSNIGPGFGRIGPSWTYVWMTDPAKILLAFEMILGRLELYTFLVLFLPAFWKK